MIKKYSAILITIILFTSCLTNVEEKVPLVSKEILNKPIIHITDRARNVKIEKSYIFKSGYQGNAYAYGDLLKLENGKLLLACNSGKQITDWTSLYLILSESSDNGKTWSIPRRIDHSITESYLYVGGPSLINIGDGHIMLFFLAKYSEKRIDIMYKESFDYGSSWGDDRIVYKTNQGYTTTNNNRVLYSNKRIIIPLAVPNDADNLFKSIENNMSVFYYYSDDLGKTWSRSNNLTLPNVALLEPDIVRISDFELLMNIRLNLGFILFARSKDNGKKWFFESSDIASSSSPQKIIKLPQSNSLLMIWNYVKINNQWHHGGNRNPLSLAFSLDKGYSWEYIADIENNQEYDYGYPSMSIIEDTLYATYYEIWKGKGNYSLKLAKIATKDIRNE